ncbi:MAG: M48 family metalloprotease [Desulfobacterales bacterium]|nr:M48 family metalloprotease [Desulfobacterales bacterium]
MFGNFIYFIVVLLIYSTYQPSDKTNFAPVETLIAFAALSLLFYGLVWLVFRQLKKQAASTGLVTLDYRYSRIQGRLSVLAIITFTLNIYGLNLPSFLARLALFAQLPTLGAVLFIALFVGYLAIIWYHAHPVGRMLGGIGESRRAFIRSNITFSIPVLIPWFIISLTADLLALLPFDFIKHIQSNPAGEIAFFSVLLLAIAITAPAMIQRFWGCKPLEAGIHRDRIEALCKQARVTCADILNWPIFGGRMLTAGVMGLVNRFRYILVTDALLQHLSCDEIDAVIAHEIGHVKKHHLQFYLFFFLGFLLVFYAIQDILIFLVSYLNYRLLSAGLFNTVSYPAIYAIFNVVFIILFLLYFRYLFGFFIRNFERQADAYVFDLLPSAFPLIRSLEKVALTSGQSPDKPNWHHFSITERIAFLLRCEHDRHFIQRHDRKLKNSMLAYVLFLCLAMATGWFITPRIPTEQLTNNFLEKLIVLEIEKSPGNAGLYHDLANVYINKRKFAEAITAYRHAIWLNPKFPSALNNLAWLYATCEDENLRDPEKALKLALSAAEFLPKAHILDTLAEAYYINGQYQQALLSGKQALQTAEENRDYYLRQVQRFQKAQKGVMVDRPEVERD